MIINSTDIKFDLSTEQDFTFLMNQVKNDLLWSDLKGTELYYFVSNSYKIPLHLAFLVVRRLERGFSLTLEELSSSSFYSICRDLLVPYKKRDRIFLKWFGLKYPSPTNMAKRIEWFLRLNNGLDLRQKVDLITGQNSFTRCGIGRTTVQTAMKMINISANHDDIKKRRMVRFEKDWSASICSYVDRERGNMTAAELLMIAAEFKQMSGINIKKMILTSILKNLGKVEVYFLCQFIAPSFEFVIPHNLLANKIAEVYKIDRKIVRQIVGMQSVNDLADIIVNKKSFADFMTVKPFTPFRPMLAARWVSKNKFPVAVEAKYDGMRLTVHKVGNQVSFYSRRRKDFTNRLSSFRDFLTSINCPAMVLDGELIGIKVEDGKKSYLTIYEVLDNLNDPVANVLIYYVVFDILYFNGIDLSSYPMKHRRNLRDQMVSGINQTSKGSPIILPETVDAYNPYQVTKIYNRYLAEGLEGAIIKDLDSGYEFGQRSTAWLKLKPTSNIDVVVTGIIPTSYESSIVANGFRFAVKSGDKFVNMGVVTNLSERMGNRLIEMALKMGLVDANLEMEVLEVEMDDKIRMQDKTRWGFPTLPRIVVEIDFLGIIKKDGNYSLRNPRFLQIRYEKPVDEIVTIAGIDELFAEQASE